MQHRAGVAERPIRAARNLLADEPVLETQAVVGERLRIEQVAKPAVEFFIAVVGNSQETILDTERIGKVLSWRITTNLRNPAVEVDAIEQRHPRRIGDVLLSAGPVRHEQQQ